MSFKDLVDSNLDESPRGKVGKQAETQEVQPAKEKRPMKFGDRNPNAFKELAKVIRIRMRYRKKVRSAKS